MIQRLLTLNINNFGYCVSDIELAQVFLEFVVFNLSIIEEIVHHETHGVG